MSINKIALIVGILIVLIIAVWGFANLSPLLGSLLGGPTGTVTINDHSYKVFLADTPEKQQKGLSGKKSLPDDQGMLFTFSEAGFPSFWMKDMQFPIDIIFINDTKVTTIYENVPAPASQTPLPLYKPQTASDKVLELNAGQVKTAGIKTGDIVKIEKKK